MILEDSFSVFEKANDMKVELTEPPMRDYVENSGLSAGQVFGVLRVAVTGQTVSPPLFESMEILGKEKVLERIKNAIKVMR